jgi:uncharacterized protein YbjT (DUF2867 family)
MTKVKHDRFIRWMGPLGESVMTILVSNANGKIGQEVAKALLQAGHKTRIGVRHVDKAKVLFPGAEIVPLDVTQPATLAPALHGIAAVFAALPYELQPAADQALIAASAEAGVTRFVKLSAMGTDADPSSPHMLAENSLAASGLEWTVLRPNFFMQNYATMMADQVRSGAIYEPAAEGATSFVDARDIAAVALAALTQPGHNRQIYALTGPAALTRAEVAATLTRVVGKKVTYIAIDDEALRNGMAGAPASLVALTSALYGYVRQGFTATLTPDVTRVTGRPAHDFASFAADHAAAWKA